MTIFLERVLIEGLMPERALLRLRRANIGIYNLKKPQKNQILFSVKKKDIEKVFAIYPDVCYNVSVHTPYKARRMGMMGIGKFFERIKNRVGLLLGALLALIAFSYADSYIFAVEFTGAQVYRREALMLLEQGGIQPFSPYKREKTDWICSQILALDDVEYCSVKKSGLKAVVEIRLSDFEKPTQKEEDMLCSREGKIISITTLRGTPLKKAGDEVRQGETLVGGWFLKEDGTSVSVAPIARVSIACLLESAFEAQSEEEAFAKAYLSLRLSEKDTITDKEIKQEGNLFYVKIAYTAIEQMNM